MSSQSESAKARDSAALNTSKRSPQVSRFETMLRERVIGQGNAIDAILDS